MIGKKSRRLCCVLVLGLAPLSLHAQKDGDGSDPPEDGTCACQAGGARCLFGSVEGCSVTCRKAICHCQSASCFFGWPMPSKCWCEPIPQ